MLAGPGLDQWLSRVPATGSASYYLSDALGSTVGLADPSGVVTTSYTYEPFGRTTVSGTSSTNPFAFTGREEDSTGALSLYHYRARYYSPALQRFLTEDPVGFAGGDANLYGYVGNAPTVAIDRRGLCKATDPFSTALDSLGAFGAYAATSAEQGRFGPAGLVQAIRVARGAGAMLVAAALFIDFSSARCEGDSIGRAVVESLSQNAVSVGTGAGAMAVCVGAIATGPWTTAGCAIVAFGGALLGRWAGDPIAEAAGGIWDWLIESDDPLPPEGSW
jgi:RHS repeat-associated protein